ncbi:MAG: molybdopterin molybdotransferase MoeA [Acidimicrobiales bacterium]
MIPLDDARARIDRDISQLPSVLTPIGESSGLVLDETIVASESMPPFANTAMDGFAVHAIDLAGASEDSPVRLPVAGTIPAGSVATHPLAPGTTMRIMTGAPLPEGADAVIMVELSRPVDDEFIDLIAEVPTGNHVRPAGDDLREGDVVFAAGTVITPAHVGILASLGRESVRCIRRPRVGVFSTGDELVVGPVALQPGQIRDSNRPGLLAAVTQAGFDAVDLGLLPDDEAIITAALNDAVRRCDVLLTTGGVSMGDFDFVKIVLGKLGDFNWMQVAIRPAKPLAFGIIDETPVFGLPGNPVSSMVSFELFAKPALRKMMGLPKGPGTIIGLADEPFLRHPDGKTHFVRVQAKQEADGAWRVRSAGEQGSHQLSAMAAANALAVLPDGDGVAAGGALKIMLLNS